MDLRALHGRLRLDEWEPIHMLGRPNHDGCQHRRHGSSVQTVEAATTASKSALVSTLLLVRIAFLRSLNARTRASARCLFVTCIARSAGGARMIVVLRERIHTNELLVDASFKDCVWNAACLNHGHQARLGVHQFLLGLV